MSKKRFTITVIYSLKLEQFMVSRGFQAFIIMMYISICQINMAIFDRRLISLVGKVPVYRAGGSGSIPSRTNTQGLKIIEEKVLPLL